MTVLVLAEQPREIIDAGAGQVDERAVEPSLIDTLVGAAVAGDLGARDRLLAEVHRLVLGYCRRRLGREDLVIGSADDVAQEVCIAVVGALSRYTVKGCRSGRSSTASPRTRSPTPFGPSAAAASRRGRICPTARSCTTARSSACSPRNSPSGCTACCTCSHRGSATW